MSDLVQATPYGSGQINNPANLCGQNTDGNYAQIYGGGTNDGGVIIGWMNMISTGHIYLYGYSAAGYYTHLYVYVSMDNYNDWVQITPSNFTVYPDSAQWIDCGSYSGYFRYISIVAINDAGYSANIYLDAVRVEPPSGYLLTVYSYNQYGFAGNVKLWVDGKYAGTTGSSCVIPVTPGNHTLQVPSPIYLGWSIHIFQYYAYDGGGSPYNPMTLSVTSDKTVTAYYYSYYY
jgi:hypothetical protein